MDYSFFDGLVDAVFVIKDDRGVVYCNNAAAKLCDTSVRRLSKGRPIYETIEFLDSDIFANEKGTDGRDEPLSYVEVKFKLKSGKAGKVQVAIQPFTEVVGDKRWAVMIRDVTLEEVLHSKYHKQLEEKEVYIKQLKDAQTQLEAYSKNLEGMVEVRTPEVKRANVMLSAIMNSLGQGFLVFDSEGNCSDVYTRACESVLECNPNRKKIWDVLRVVGKELETFKMWISAVFSEQLPFDSLKELGPALYPHSKDRYVKLDYFPLRSETGRVSNVVLVATDQTSEIQATRALEKEKKYAKMVIKLVTGRRQFRQFLNSADEKIREIQNSVMDISVTFDHQKLFRELHTLEGEAGSYYAAEIWSSSREAQEVLEPLKKGESADIQNVRLALAERMKKVRSSYDLFMSENKDLFRTAGIGQSEKIEISVKEVESVLNHLQQKNVDSSICEFIASALLKEPVVEALKHYQDVVALVAQKLNKQVKPVEFHGENVKAFTQLYSDLFSSLIHVFRNVVDHGIEPKEDREMMGKDPAGRVQVTASEIFKGNSKWIRIEVSDDGQGISLEGLRKKIVSNFSAEALKAMSDQVLMQKVFDSGVSTKDAVGEFSGRGIGLNAVKMEAEKLGGSAWVESNLGQGTRLIVEVPDLQRVARSTLAA